MAPCNFFLKDDFQNFVLLINWKILIPDKIFSITMKFLKIF